MKKISWIVYGVIVLLLTLLGLFLAFTENVEIGTVSFRSAFTLLTLLGLYGYIYQKEILNPSVWKFILWLKIVASSILAITIFFLSSIELVIDYTFGLIISLPMLYALYKYSLNSNPVWKDMKIFKNVTLLSNLLKENKELTSSVTSSAQTEKIKTTVTVKSEDNEISVKIEKDNEPTTVNEFTDIVDVMKFIENNTIIRVSDFA